MTPLSATESLLIALRKKNCTASLANTLASAALADPGRALRKLSARGFVEQHVTKAGPVVEGKEKVWRITSAGREYISSRLKAIR